MKTLVYPWKWPLSQLVSINLTTENLLWLGSKLTPPLVEVLSASSRTSWDGTFDEPHRFDVMYVYIRVDRCVSCYASESANVTD